MYRNLPMLSSWTNLQKSQSITVIKLLLLLFLLDEAIDRSLMRYTFI